MNTVKAVAAVLIWLAYLGWVFLSLIFMGLSGAPTSELDNFFIHLQLITLPALISGAAWWVYFYSTSSTKWAIVNTAVAVLVPPFIVLGFMFLF